MEPGTAAAILVYENTWAAPFATASAQDRRQAGGIRPHPNQRPDRNTRRARSRRGQLGESKNAKIDENHGPHRSRRRHGNRSFQSGIATAAETVGRIRPTLRPIRNSRRRRAPAPPAAPSTDDKLEQLKELGALKESGILTDAEFEAQKAKILAG